MEIEVVGAIDRGLNDMLERNGERIVESLSSRYGFSKREAMKELEMVSVKVEVKKEKVKRSEKSKIPLPFCGEIQENNCEGIRLNHGLYTQCTNLHDNKDKNGHKLCGTCYKQTEKNSNGEPTYGYISDRMEKGDTFRDPKGKVPVLYGNIMEKLLISREDAEKEAAHQGLTIPEEQFQVKKAQRGRPKKDTMAVDTSGSEASTEPVSEDEQKKPRGRPKKDKKVVASVGEELIKNLVKDSGSSGSSGGDPQTPQATLKGGAQAELQVAPLQVAPLQVAPLQVAPLIPPDELPSPPKIISTPPQKFQNKGVETVNVETVPTSDDEESSDDEELAVVEFKIKDTKYLKSANNTLYCPKTHEEVGVWNPKTKTIDALAESDDD